MNNWRRFVVVTACVAAAACWVLWVVASYVNGRLLARALEAAEERPREPVGMAFVGLEHEVGFLASQGRLVLRLTGGCSKRARTRAPVMRIDYTVEHTLTLDSTLRVHWKASPERVFGKAVKPLIGDRALLEGVTVRGYDGSYRTSFHTMPTSLHTPQGALELSAAEGTATFNERQLRVVATLPHALLQFEGVDFEVNGMSLQWNLPQRARVVGATSTRFRSLRIEQARFDQLHLTSKGTEHPGQLELRLAARAQAYDVPGTLLHDLALEMFAHNLEPQAFEQVLSLAGNSCGPLALFGESSPALRSAAQALFGQDFSLEVTQLRARSNDGALDGLLRFEVARATAGGSGSLLSRVRSSGELRATGTSLSRFLLESRLRPSLETTSGPGVHANYTFEQRNLMLNGRPVNPTFVNATLSIVDTLLSSI